MMLWWDTIKALRKEISQLKSEERLILKYRDDAWGKQAVMRQELECLKAENNILKLQIECNKPAPPPKYKEDLQQPIFQKIFKKGRKALLLETHPDHGGTREAMEEVEAAFEILKEIQPVKMQSGIGAYNEDTLRQRFASGLGGMTQAGMAADLQRQYNRYSNGW